MSPESWRVRAEHMLAAIGEIRDFTAGMDRDAFKADVKTVRAVCMDFNIIGEAAKHLPDDVTARASHIEWRKIRSMRNFVVHVYHAIDDDLLWDTIETDLGPLEAALQDLLAASPEKE